MRSVKVKILSFFIWVLLLATPTFVSAVEIKWVSFPADPIDVMKGEIDTKTLTTSAGKDTIYTCEQCGKFNYLSGEKNEAGEFIITFDSNKVGGGVGSSSTFYIFAAHKDSPSDTLEGKLIINLLPADSSGADSTPEETPEEAEADPSGGYGGKLGKPPGYKGPLPDCVWREDCRDVNDFITLIINWGDNLFALIGSLAFVMFVYGGFMMIFSAGNAEHVKKGQQILVAAVVGLIIAFSAYLLIRFILDALDVSAPYRAIK